MDRTLTDQEEADFFSWYHDVRAEEFHHCCNRPLTVASHWYMKLPARPFWHS